MTIGKFVVDVNRFRKLSAKPKFISKFYSPQEMKFLMEKHFPIYRIAEMFTAKMAFMKAMGVSARGCKLNEVSVLTDYNGIYYISLSGKAKTVFAAKRCKIAVDCTHTRIAALATVILYE
ncbi:MAG: 4'-phosphopantetheinyl transferase superfamily protein [Oscillospiraceae bacterium]|nr:4'-phosphopantetheinyl transferase superfamily protein [Oscillospiraceae bacterium]